MVPALRLDFGQWGVGVTHYSIFYLSSARNFIEGNGLK
jgi:hypothetical protein